MTLNLLLFSVTIKCDSHKTESKPRHLFSRAHGSENTYGWLILISFFAHNV